MGDWTITIEGTGCHHNDIEDDADQLARQMVTDLRAAGHTVHRATFTCGGRLELEADPHVMPANWRELEAQREAAGEEGAAP